jgi:hypothetical protein
VPAPAPRGFHTSSPGPLQLAFTLTAWTQVSLLRTVLRRGPALVRLHRLRRLRILAGDLAARRPVLEQLLRNELSREYLSQAPERVLLRRAIVTPAPSGRCAGPREWTGGGKLRDAVDAEPSGYALDFKASVASRNTGAPCS